MAGKPLAGDDYAEYLEFKEFKEWQKRRGPKSMEPAPAPPPTVKELYASFLADPLVKRQASYRSRCSYQKRLVTTLIALPDGTKRAFGDFAWNELSPDTCDRFREASYEIPTQHKKPPQDNSIDQILGALQSAIRAAITKRDGVVTHDPIAGFWRSDPREFSRKTYLTDDQRALWVGEAHPQFQEMTFVEERCVGMRPGEVRFLRKQEVNWATMTITILPGRVKNRRPSTIPIPKDIIPILKRHMAISRGPYVFVAPADPKRMKPVSASTFGGWSRRARRKAGIVGDGGERIVPYHLRHKGITDALAAGGEPAHVAHAARTSLEQVEKTYSKWKLEQLEQLRAALDRPRAAPVRFAPPPDDDDVPE